MTTVGPSTIVGPSTVIGSTMTTPAPVSLGASGQPAGPSSTAYLGPYTWPGIRPAPTLWDGRFWVGPLGAMRTLPDIRGEVDTTARPIGGTHTSLTGSYVRDRFGIKRAWSWTYPLLTARQVKYVEALHNNLIPGPLYLIDPNRPNRLPEQIATGGTLKRNATGFIGSNTTLTTWRPLNATPASQSTLPASPILRGALEWQMVAAGNASLDLAGFAGDGRLDIPVRSLEPMLVSAWACGPNGASFGGTVTAFDAQRNQVGSFPLREAALTRSSWAQTRAALICPEDVAYLRVRFTVGSSTPVGSVYVTALSVARFQQTVVPGLMTYCDDDDPGGGWSLGGGAPQVVPDLGPTGYSAVPRLHSSTLTLIER